MDEKRLQQIEQDIFRLKGTPADAMQLRMFCGTLIEEVRRLQAPDHKHEWYYMPDWPAGLSRCIQCGVFDKPELLAKAG